MTEKELHNYMPNEYEAEKASNSYLMSVVAIMVGLPLPIINLIATLIFFLGNLKQSLYIRWHCTQALLSQCVIVIFNSIGFSWTMTIIFGSNTITNTYFAYMLTIVFFNIFEFAVTIYTAIVTRKGKHVVWRLFGSLTNILLRIKN